MRFLALSASVLILAACSGEPVPAPEAAPEPAVAAPPPAPAATPAEQTSPTVGGDGSPIVLDTLSASDIEGATLAGELACSFGSTAGTLVLAKGNVGGDDPAVGVVKVAGYVERIAAPGGFNAMVKGQTFSGQGKTVVIALTGPATAGGESPPAPATLTYQRADGASRVFPGTWTCGP